MTRRRPLYRAACIRSGCHLSISALQPGLIQAGDNEEPPRHYVGISDLRTNPPSVESLRSQRDESTSLARPRSFAKFRRA